MFTVLKLIKPFFLPPTLVLVGLAAALILAVRKRRKWTVRVLAVTLLGYYLFSIEPTAYYLGRSLERAIPEPAGEGEPVAVLVLAGGFRRAGNGRPFSELSGPSWRRLWRGIEIYRELEGAVPILFAGGSGDPFDPEPGQARLARGYALAMGIPPEDFWSEEESRDTYENLREARAILDREFPGRERHRVILVTSAIHMLRSVLAARKAGLDPVPAPADYEYTSPAGSPLAFFPDPRAFLFSTRCLHEWLGIAAYRLRGRL